MYPENIQELINATEALLLQIFPPSNVPLDANEMYKAWLRAAEAVRVLRAMENELPALPESKVEG